DASHPDPASQLATVRDVIGEVGGRDIPEVVAFNKADLADDDQRLLIRGLEPDGIFVSARTGEGIQELLERISDVLPTPSVVVDMLIPYDRGDVVASLHDRAVIDTTTYEEGGTRIHGRVREQDVAGLQEFIADE
ncbi:GTPase HflX, partial [Shewanella sp. SR1]|nr:GTPase HflX [Shewanella sp. SR1]